MSFHQLTLLLVELDVELKPPEIHIYTDGQGCIIFKQWWNFNASLHLNKCFKKSVTVRIWLISQQFAYICSTLALFACIDVHSV